MKKSFIVLLALLLFALNGYAESIIKKGDVDVKKDQKIGDLVVVDGDVYVDGSVYGVIYTLDSKVTLSKNAKVYGNITINRGRLEILGGATLTDDVLIVDGDLKVNGKLIENTGSKNDVTEITYNKTNIKIINSPLDPDLVITMKKYLVFDRKVPSSDTSIKKFEKISLKDLNLDRKGVNYISDFDIIGLSKISLPSSQVEEGLEANFSNDKQEVYIRMVKLKKDTYLLFWSNVRKLPESYLKESVHISFGEGAHWFFKHNDYYTVMWVKDRWFICIEVLVKDRNLSKRQMEAEAEKLRSKVIEEVISNY